MGSNIKNGPKIIFMFKNDIMEENEQIFGRLFIIINRVGLAFSLLKYLVSSLRGLSSWGVTLLI